MKNIRNPTTNITRKSLLDAITPRDRGYATAFKNKLKEKNYLDKDNDIIDLTGMKFRSIKDAKEYRKRRTKKHRDYYKKHDLDGKMADQIVGQDFDPARANIIKMAEKRLSGGMITGLEPAALQSRITKDLDPETINKLDALQESQGSKVLQGMENVKSKISEISPISTFTQDSAIKKTIDGAINKAGQETTATAIKKFDDILGSSTDGLKSIIESKKVTQIIHRALDRHFKEKVFNELDLRDEFMEGLGTIARDMIKKSPENKSEMEKVLMNMFNKKACKKITTN